MKAIQTFIESLFTSYSGYFLQGKEILAEERKRIDLYLQLKGYDLSQRAIYLRAFDYFSMFPEEFDGATMTEDLCDLPGIDLDAMLHDWLYIAYNVAGNYYYIWLADKLIRAEMRKKGKSTINGGLRFVLLTVKTLLLYPAASYLFRGRRMTRELKVEVASIYRTLATGIPKPWHKEYRGEIGWSLTIVSLLTYIIFKF